MKIQTWRSDLKRWLEVPPKVDDDKVYAASRHHRLQALENDDGTVLWSRNLSDKLLEAPQLLDDTLLLRGVEGDTGSFIGLDKESGRTRWSQTFSPRWKFKDLKSNDGTLVLRRDPLAGSDDEPILLGVSPQTGETIWELDSSARSWGVPVKDSEGHLFVELRDRDKQSVVSVDQKTGSVLWTHEGGLWGQPRPLESSLLLATRLGVTVLDSVTGSVAWQHDQELTREPWVLDQAVVLAGGRKDSIPGDRLTVLTPESGKVLWSIDTAHLSGVAQGPEHQLLYHSYKLDPNGRPEYALHSLDSRTGQPLWSQDLGASEIEGLGTDSQGRVTVALAKGRRRELLVIDDGQVLWRKSIHGKGLAVAGNGDSMAIIDQAGVTLVDSQTGAPQEQVKIDSPLLNYDAEVAPGGRLAVSGIDGEIVSLKLPGAETILEPTEKTPGKMRHYRYAIEENSQGNLYADVKADGKYVTGDDALLVTGKVEQDLLDPKLVTGADLVGWDDDVDYYLSRAEMKEASLSLWWDRDFDGKISPIDGVVAMAAEGSRQAVVDLDHQMLEVRTRPVSRQLLSTNHTVRSNQS